MNDVEEVEASLVHGEPDAFQPCSGKRGLRGATKITLAAAKQSTVKQALLEAWCNTAPKRLIQQLDEQQQASAIPSWIQPCLQHCRQ